MCSCQKTAGVYLLFAFYVTESPKSDPTHNEEHGCANRLFQEILRWSSNKYGCWSIRSADNADAVVYLEAKQSGQQTERALK